MGCKTSLATIQLCHCSMKAATDNSKTNGHGQIGGRADWMWPVGPSMFTVHIFNKWAAPPSMSGVKVTCLGRNCENSKGETINK